MDNLDLDFHKETPLLKVVDGPNGLAVAYGIVTAELADKVDEICDYDASAPLYQDWSNDALRSTSAAGQELSLGNIRLQHSMEIAGKAIALDFVPDRKEIWLRAEAADERISNMLRRGLVRGFSQGGRYIWRRCNVCEAPMPPGTGNDCPICQRKVLARYAAKPSEVSFVDNPCLTVATFAYVRADGSTELRKFAPADKDGKEEEANSRMRKSFVMPALTEEQCRRAEAGEDPQLTDEQREAFENLRDMVDKATPRNPKGKFSCKGSGPVHDLLVGHGYAHERSGSSQQHGTESNTDTTQYCHSSGAKVTIHSDGKWVYDKNGSQVTGTDAASLESHLANCHAPKANAKVEKADVECPDCGNLIEVEEGVSEGDEFNCGQCDAELRVVATEPLEVTAKAERSGQDVIKAVAQKSRIDVAALRKDFWSLASLADLLARIKSLQSSARYESAAEGGDEVDLAIAEQLGRWLTSGVAILGQIVTHEMEEMMAAAKADVHAKETNTMKNITELVKAAQEAIKQYFTGLTETFKAQATACANQAADQHQVAKGLSGGTGELQKASSAITKAHAEHLDTLAKQFTSMAEHCAGLLKALDESLGALASAAQAAPEAADVKKAIEDVSVLREEVAKATAATTSDALSKVVEERVKVAMDVATTSKVHLVPRFDLQVGKGVMAGGDHGGL